MFYRPEVKGELKRIFWTDFRKVLQYQISPKSVQWESSCSTRSARRTDRHNGANGRSSQFSEYA